MMQSLRQLIGNDLLWGQTGISRSYDIHGENHVFGRLSFQSVLGSLATAECSDGLFTLKRQGFLKPTITIRRTGTENDIGRVAMDAWHHGGMVELRERGRYQFIKMGFLQPEWSILDANGGSLLRLSVRSGLRYHGEVHIEPFAKDDRNLSLLCLVALYAIILMNEEAAAAASI